jgi:3',5'-cyclic AMP phosphodiesterase CpdA
MFMRINKIRIIGLSILFLGVFYTNLFAILVTGKVTGSGKTLSGVQITDGTNIIETDKNGNYSLEVVQGNSFVYYTLPKDYESPIVEGIPVFFSRLNKDLKTQKVNFELTKSEKSQLRHNMIVWADPQVLELDEFNQLQEVIDDVNKTIASFPADIPFHAISAGDNVFDRLHFFDKYKQMISQVKVPFYQVIGNHDMDYNNRSNELSNKSFTAAFGPSHFSFNRGNIHYVILKDVFYYGFSYRYIGYIDENQLQWLEKDLKNVRPGSTVVVSMHIPTICEVYEKADYGSTLSNSVMNREALYKILSPFNTHILAGHTHTNCHTQAKPNIVEHVHAAASGAWWQGEVCTDGSPKGYTVYEIDGDSISWYYKGVAHDKNHQLKLYGIGAETAQPESFIANVYNYDTKWKVCWYEDGNLMGEMTRYWGTDLLAGELYQPGKNKKHGWLSAGITHHLFEAKAKNPNAKIKVVVTDQFGNIYSETLKN